MHLFKNWYLYVNRPWVWPEIEFRWNGGGYLYGAAPYKQWSIGPLRLRKYLTKF